MIENNVEALLTKDFDRMVDYRLTEDLERLFRLLERVGRHCVDALKTRWQRYINVRGAEIVIHTVKVESQSQGPQLTDNTEVVEKLL